MKMYRFTLRLDYTLKANNEWDAMHELVALMRQDWPFYAIKGDWEEVESTIPKPHCLYAETTLEGKDVH